VFYRDLISDFSPQAQICLQIVLAVVALSCAWIVFDTRRSLNMLARLGPSWLPLREKSISLANHRGVIWFYRVDSAIVFTGIVLTLVLHWLAR
jgi:hypothetical protein